MQYKTIIMVFVLLAAFATMTMARNMQESSENENALDEPRFSLRELLDLAAPEKRTDVHVIYFSTECSLNLSFKAPLSACN